MVRPIRVAKPNTTIVEMAAAMPQVFSVDVSCMAFTLELDGVLERHELCEHVHDYEHRGSPEDPSKDC